MIPDGSGVAIDTEHSFDLSVLQGMQGVIAIKSVSLSHGQTGKISVQVLLG